MTEIKAMDADAAAAFWLPSHFLNDDEDFTDIALSTYPPTKGTNSYLYGSSSSALDSPVSSEDTEPDRDEFLAELTRQLARSSLLDETHIHHQPPHHFQKLTLASSRNLEMATSPQSTLAGYAARWATSRSGDVTPNNGYPSRGKSPPVLDAWDQVYAAAIEVARMKMSAAATVAAAAAAQEYHLNRGILGLPRNPLRSTLPMSNGGSVLLRGGCAVASHNYPHNINDCCLQTRQHMRKGRSCGDGGDRCGACGYIGGGCSGGALGLPLSAWPPLKIVQQEQGRSHNIIHHPVGSSMTNPFAGVGTKRQSAGTGVFLPRKYGTTSPAAAAAEPRKKTAGCSTMILPARMVQALNLGVVEETNPHAFVHQHQSQLVPESEVILARRNAAAVAWTQQQRRSSSMMAMRAAAAASAASADQRPLNHEPIHRLPQEWTY